MKKRRQKLILTISFLLLITVHYSSAATVDEETGLIIDKGFDTVKKNCTPCHSARLITQNRMDRQRWIETIRWMQETQGLRQFEPEIEKEILDYLTSHYGPQKTYRRLPLSVEWE